MATPLRPRKIAAVIMLSVFIVESPSWQGDIALPTEVCRLPAGTAKLPFRKLNSILVRANGWLIAQRGISLLWDWS
jgi:hypothetical protein